MTLDGLTLHAVVAELKKSLVGAKVQKVLMPSKEEIVLQLYSASGGNVKLAISADAGGCSLYLSSAQRQNPKTPPSFCMLLRKHLSSATIEDIEQDGLDRVAIITFAAKDELLHKVTLKLIVEIMGKYSNIILTGDEGRIIDSIRRVPLDVSSKRQILPGLTYSDPPQKKYNPLALLLPTISGLLEAGEDTRIATRISSVLGGISTKTADEMLYRADIGVEYTSALNQDKALKLASTIKSFLDGAIGNPLPCVQLNSDGLPVFFSCVPYETYPSVTRVEFKTCNAMLDYYYTRRAEMFRLTQQKDALSKSIAKILARVEKLINIYQASIDDSVRAAKFQKRADLITANLYRLKKGMKDFIATDYETGEDVSVALDVSLTPQQLAQKLYKKVAKAKKAASMNSEKLKSALDEQEFLLGALHYAENAQGTDDIEDIKQSLVKAGYLSAPPKSAKASKAGSGESLPLKFTSPSGYEIYVGKNDRQNDILTMHTASKDDIWFHAQKIPGSHVVLMSKGTPLNEIDDKTVEYAAQLAASHSRARHSGKTPVDYTERKNVKKPPGVRPGKVIYDNYYTIYVDANL